MATVMATVQTKPFGSESFIPVACIKLMISDSPISVFPLWQYLCQPIGQRDRQLIISPKKFWHLQKVHYIERCWVMSSVPERHTS